MPLPTTLNYQLNTIENCGIHQTCPEACSGYTCGWLHGWGSEGDRPDKTGILIDDLAGPQIVKGGLVAKPLWLGAESQPNGIATIEQLSRDSNRPVIVLEFTERQILRVVGKGAE